MEVVLAAEMPAVDARERIMPRIRTLYAAMAFGVGRWLAPSPPKDVAVIRSIIPLPAGTALSRPTASGSLSPPACPREASGPDSSRSSPW